MLTKRSAASGDENAIFIYENRSNAFLFTSKGLMLEGFTTFMDCCLRTRASNVVRNEVDFLGGID